MAINDILAKLIICQYCNKTFKTEQSLISHKCKVQEKYELGKTREGLLARQIYTYWLKQQKRKVPEYDAFINSKLFTHFYKFACSYYLNMEQSWEPFVDVMLQNKISPNNWTNTDVIQLYINQTRGQQYESFVLDFIDKCLEDDTYLLSFTTISVDELLTKIYSFNFPINFILQSNTFRQIIEQWTVEQMKEFELFCKSIQLEQIMKNQNIIKSTRLLLQHFKLN